jgi:hypothetical protein
VNDRRTRTSKNFAVHTPSNPSQRSPEGAQAVRLPRQRTISGCRFRIQLYPGNMPLRALRLSVMRTVVVAITLLLLSHGSFLVRHYRSRPVCVRGHCNQPIPSPPPLSLSLTLALCAHPLEYGNPHLASISSWSKRGSLINCLPRTSVWFRVRAKRQPPYWVRAIPINFHSVIRPRRSFATIDNRRGICSTPTIVNQSTISTIATCAAIPLIGTVARRVRRVGIAKVNRDASSKKKAIRVPSGFESEPSRPVRKSSPRAVPTVIAAPFHNETELINHHPTKPDQYKTPKPRSHGTIKETVPRIELA